MIDQPLTVGRLLESILVENPLHKNFLDVAVKNLHQPELLAFEEYLLYCCSRGFSIGYLTECYLTLVEDTLSEQIYFQQHKRYRYSSFDEVSRQVYFNTDYMDRYMYGLAISSFLWPNHIAISRFFLHTLPKDQVGRYLEVGPGHGQFMLTAIREGSYDEHMGIDISAASTAQTQQIIEHLAPQHTSGLRLETRDFLADELLQGDGFDAIVAGEVVEHVEQPALFFRRIAELARPDTYIFLTTCINTPAIDHIYLWRTPQELLTMIRDSGLVVKDQITLPYHGKTLDEALQQDLSVNFAFVLSKAQ